MKTYFTLLSLLFTFVVNAQKYITKNGNTQFKASVEAFEPVEAENQSTTAILNTETGQMAALVFVKAFHFEIALMEEHFNENYMDSDEHPKATFKGEIKTFDLTKLTSTPQEYILIGTLTVRGIEKQINTNVKIHKDNKGIHVLGAFKVQPQEFKIDIPSLIRKKIAEHILIEFDYVLQPK